MKTLIILGFTFQIIFFAGCTKSSEQKSHTKDQTTIFLENLMIREGGLYTLLGSKPVTIFNINMSFPEEDHEIIQYYNSIRSESTCEASAIPSIEDFRIECKKLANSHMNRKKLWILWKERPHKTLSRRFIIDSRTCEFGEEAMGLFINVPLLEYTLVDNFELFERETQVIFDPYSVVNEIFDASSPFWNKVFSNHFLLGILLGYGKKNSFIFSCNSKVETEVISSLNEIQKTNVQLSENVSISDLQPPMFLSFAIYDEEIQKYSHEKEKIVEFYKDRDFKEMTLELLKVHSILNKNCP